MAHDELTPEENAEISALVKRTNTEKPKKDDVKALRALLDKHPDLWRSGGDLAIQTQQLILSADGMSAASREFTRAALDAMRQGLDYSTSPMLEQMLIEQVLLAWLRLNVWEYKYTGMNEQGMSLPVAEFWEKRVSAAQRRYLRAVETLARVRKITRATLQVNIAEAGSQQVNVAGDLVRKLPDGA